MRIRTFRGILDECLESIRRGGTIEDCLARYPKHAERLRPLLTLAARVRGVPPVQPRPWAQATAWDLVRRRAAELRSGKRRRGLNVSLGPVLRPAAIALALVFAIMGGGGATAIASQSALPDSPLYRVKLMTEDARLWFVFDDSQEADILLDQSDERMSEIRSLARQGKPISSNVLSAMEDRHERAADIITDLDTGDSDRPELLRRLLDQSASQEDSLLALWDNVSPGGRDDYTEVVAQLHNTRLQGATDLVLSPDDLSGGIQQISGVLQQENGVWTIAGDIEVTIDERTIGVRELEPGSTATGIFARDGTRLQALSLFAIQQPSAIVSGTIEEVSEDGVTIAGQFIPFDANTIRRSKLKLGDHVDIEVARSEQGDAVATEVSQSEPADAPLLSLPLMFAGTIEDGAGVASQMRVSGVEFVLPESASIDASAGPKQEGARVLIEATREGRDLLARNVTILSEDADADEVFFAGTFRIAEAGLWSVSGVPATPPDGLQPPPEDSFVAVDAVRRTDDDGRVILLIEEFIVLEEPDDAPVTRVLSTIRSLEGNHWDVGIGLTRVNESATISGDPEVGDWVLMWGRKSDEGVFQATYVHVLD